MRRETIDNRHSISSGFLTSAAAAATATSAVAATSVAATSAVAATALLDGFQQQQQQQHFFFVLDQAGALFCTDVDDPCRVVSITAIAIAIAIKVGGTERNGTSVCE